MSNEGDFDAVFEEALKGFPSRMRQAVDAGGGAGDGAPAAGAAAGSGQVAGASSDAGPGPAAPGRMTFDPLGRKRPAASRPRPAGAPEGDPGAAVGAVPPGVSAGAEPGPAVPGPADPGVDQLAADVVRLLGELRTTGAAGGARPGPPPRPSAHRSNRASAGSAAPRASAGAGPYGDDAFAETLRRLQAEVGGSGRGAGGDSPGPSVGFDPSQAFTDEELDGLADQFHGSGDSPEMHGLMDTIMRQLLSKDVLYEPLREIGSKYPAWLEEHGASLSPEELGRYRRQLECIRRICRQYEEDDGDFPAIMGMLQEMQECGQPPDDIVKELAPGMSFGPDGLPSIPAMPGPAGDGNCSVM